MSAATRSVDVSALGYQPAREALTELLALCVARLRRGDLDLARDLLGIDDPDAFEGAHDIHALIGDTALYSRPGDAVSRMSRKRPIDRIVRKLPASKGLFAHITARLPAAIFSVFEVTEVQANGRIVVLDLLDEARRIEITDLAMAPRVRAGMLIAARFVDLGPWHISLGIVVTLRRSEATAIMIAQAFRGGPKGNRDDLHELVYGCRLNQGDIVMEAATPVIAALATAVDAGIVPMSDLVSGLGGAAKVSRPVAAE